MAWNCWSYFCLGTGILGSGQDVVMIYDCVVNLHVRGNPSDLESRLSCIRPYSL